MSAFCRVVTYGRLNCFYKVKNQPRRRSEDGKYLLSTVMTILGKSLSRKT